MGTKLVNAESHVGRVIEESLIEANVSDQNDLENRVVGIIIPWSQDIWPIVARGALAETFSVAL